MKIGRAIVIGVGIWSLGVAAFVISHMIPVMENAELQANLVLFLAVMPLVWFGAKLYYKKEQRTQGHWLGMVFLLTAAILDALITVPFLVVPHGGSHYGFFTDISFWVIALEFMAVAILYYYTKVRVGTLKTNGTIK